MTARKRNEPKTKSRLEQEFAALSLEEKIASLMRMEAATLGETLTFLANSSAKAVEKAGDFISEISAKIENEVKKATKSAERKANGGAAKSAAPKAKASSAKRPSKPRASKS